MTAKKATSDYSDITGLKPKVKISHLAWTKIKTLLKMYDFEFCFLLEMQDPAKEVFIKDIHVIKQKGSAAYTEMDMESLNSFTLDCMTGVVPVKTENIKGWGHSHAKMGCFESGTDVDTSRKEFGALNSDWALSLVVNLAGEYYLALHVFKPVPCKYVCELDIQPIESEKEIVELERNKVTSLYELENEADGRITLKPYDWGQEEFEARVKELVTAPTYNVVKPVTNYGGYGGGYMYGVEGTEELPWGQRGGRDRRNYQKNDIDDVWDPSMGWVSKNKIENKSETKDTTGADKTINLTRPTRNATVFERLKNTMRQKIGLGMKPEVQ